MCLSQSIISPDQHVGRLQRKRSFISKLYVRLEAICLLNTHAAFVFYYFRLTELNKLRFHVKRRCKTPFLSRTYIQLKSCTGLLRCDNLKLDAVRFKMASRWTAMYFLFGFVGFVSLYVFCFIRSILYRSLRAYCRKCCGHEEDDVERYVKLQEQIAQDKQSTSKSRRNHQVPQGAQQLI